MKPKFLRKMARKKTEKKTEKKTRKKTGKAWVSRQPGLPERMEPEESPLNKATLEVSGVVLSPNSESHQLPCSQDDEEILHGTLRASKRQISSVYETTEDDYQPAGRPSPAKIQCRKAETVNAVLKVKLKHIDEEYENMRRVFRARFRLRKSHRSYRIVHRQRLFHNFATIGLEMSLLTIENGKTYFQFEYNDKYCGKMRKTMNSLLPKYHDNDDDIFVLHENTIEAVLENCATYFSMDVIQPACQSLEDIIGFMEDNFHPEFDLSDENVRLPYSYVENRVFFIAVLMHLHVLSNRGRHRTALELAKLLLNLDPSDPLSIIFIIDTLALRAREYEWFTNLYEHWAQSRNAENLFHMKYSFAMSTFHVATKNNDKAGMEKADQLIQDAILTYPYVVVFLMTVANQSNRRVMNCQLFSEAESKTPRNLQNLMQLHVKFISDQWKELEVMQWLMKNTWKVAQKFDDNAEFKDKAQNYALRTIVSGIVYPEIPREMRRHISIISPMQKFLLGNFSPDTRTLSFNPYPTQEEGDLYIQRTRMAVKKHELVHDNRNQLDLKSLAQYIQLMNDQPNYLPAPSELIKNCQDIVKCLARAKGVEDHMFELLQSVEEFLMRVVNTVTPDVRDEIVTAVLDKFYSYISDPQSNASPATSVVLIVLNERTNTSNNEAMMSAAQWLVQQGENDPAGAGLRASLSCLYTWLYEWHGTPCLGDLVMAFINALEENERFDILIEVSVDNLGRLFSEMDYPATLRQSVADVIFHVLGSLRESIEALDKVSIHVGRVLTNLASDSGQFSRQLLQTAVDVLTAMVYHILGSLKGEAQDIFKDKYSHLMLCLERHMPSRGVKYSSKRPWSLARKMPVATVTNPRPTIRKVGLLNLGNTCYMNSVMQALLVTRLFSTHVMLQMTAVPYWAKMAILFAKMMHSIATKLNPDEFFEVVKPPFFTTDNQHDSSEFLGYLFQLLQSFEHCSDKNFDYSKPPLPAAVPRHRHQPIENGNGEPAPNRRSVSPRPSSSGSTCGIKRSLPEQDSGISKKLLRFNETTSSLRRDSYIDSMFGGVLLTRVECTECHSASFSRDVFRDLQLAFPEKREGLQHSVQSLLDFYCSKERLSGENQYACPDCGGLRDAERSVIIESTPKYLILVLKNFKFEPKLGVQTKLMHPIYHNYTVALPTVRSQSEHATYSLYAAVIHDGTTLDSGHYYTLAKDNDSWHLYNDDRVTDADEVQVNALPRCNTPYVLFYKRTDLEEGAAPALEDLPPRLQEAVAAHNKHYVDQARKMRRRP